MKLGELLVPLAPVKVHVSLDTDVRGLQIDSRAVRPGDAFVAIAGTVQDGHAFIPAAWEAGACCVFAERPQAQALPHLVLRDTRIALAPLAARFYGYPSRRMTMVGVTGTKGKTTVTHLVKEIHDRVQGGCTGLIGTNRNLIGSLALPAERTTPDALHVQALLAEMADRNCGACVMEVSSHALVQSRVDEIYYDVGVFTNLTRDHLDYHSDMERYFEAKKLLFYQCKKAVINRDDPYGRRLDNAHHPLWYSLRDETADLRADNIRLLPDRVAFDALYQGRRAATVWHTPGEFSVYNALAALGTCLTLGMPLADAAEALADVGLVKGRMERVAFREGITVIIDYAHAPDALDNVLRAARESAPGRVIVLCGCGGDRDMGKRALMGGIAARRADLAIFTTDNPRSEDPLEILRMMEAGVREVRGAYRVVPDRSEAIREALLAAKEGDTVLLCGKGHETYQEIRGVKHHYDEREVIAQVRRELREHIGR